MIDPELLRKCKQDFDMKLAMYNGMYRYYNGNTDSKAGYKTITDRSNLFASSNFIQKFINEESNYCCLNKITYSSYSNNSEAIDLIRKNLRHWSNGHNKELLKQALIFQSAYELYYIDSDGLFNSLICTPFDSYVLQDDYGNVQLFIRFWVEKFDDTHTLYADVYTVNDIEHYTVIGDVFMPIPDKNADSNIFTVNKVPVGICKIGDISESLYMKLKGLQDSFETNLSDQCNLNSDLRTKYLHFKNCQPTQDQMDQMKHNATIITDGADSDVEWLQSNEVSFKDTLDTLSDLIYQQASHLNYNKPLQSNTSSLAIKGTLMGLNQKVGDDITAIIDCIKTRLQFLYDYIEIKTGIFYDWKDIDVKITANIPSDDMLAAQIVSQLKGILPIEEGLKLFSFIDNSDAVYKELQQENKVDSIGQKLLNGGDTGGNAQPAVPKPNTAN